MVSLKEIEDRIFTLVNNFLQFEDNKDDYCCTMSKRCDMIYDHFNAAKERGCISDVENAFIIDVIKSLNKVHHYEHDIESLDIKPKCETMLVVFEYVGHYIFTLELIKHMFEIISHIFHYSKQNEPAA